MRSTKNVSVRMPVGEAKEIEERAKASGLSVNSYARSLLNRERVDSAVAIALLHELVKAQHAELIGLLAEQQAQNRTTADAVVSMGERLERLKTTLQSILSAKEHAK